MNNLQIFQDHRFGEIRTFEENGKVLFCGKDVAAALGYQDTVNAIKVHCREDGVVFHHLIDTLGREQEAKFISEGNLYRLIAHSQLPAAEQFERWIFDEVIPKIHHNGSYSLISKLPDFSNPAIAARAWADEYEKRQQAEKQIVANHPKVLFADSVTASQSSILIGQLAKMMKQNGVEIGQNRLFQWLRDNNYLGKVGNNYNLPTQKSMELGLFEIKESTHVNSDGVIVVTKTPKVTGKGQVYFINKFLGGVQNEG